MTQQSYGKSRVRITKLTRTKERHFVKQLTVHTELEGDFEASYSHGDNTKVIATDTQKNIIYALGSDHPIHDIETFAIFVANRFLQQYDQVTAVNLTIEQDLWDRVAGPKGGPHPTAFANRGDEKRVCFVRAVRDKPVHLEGGIRGLSVFRSANSQWAKFAADEFRTLPDVLDRIFATVVEARWTVSVNASDFDAVYERARGALINVFANHVSLGVQATQYAICDQILKVCPEIAEVRLALPNKHHIPFDLKPLGGRANTNTIFVPQDEPHGLIKMTMTRKSRESKL